MKLSKGTQFALLFLLVITIVGLVLGFSDYRRHSDTSTFWWPAITAALFVLVLFLGKRTDVVPALALLLLAGAASCTQPPVPTGDARAEVKSCEKEWGQLADVQPTWQDKKEWAR